MNKKFIVVAVVFIIFAIVQMMIAEVHFRRQNFYEEVFLYRMILAFIGILCSCISLGTGEICARLDRLVVLNTKPEKKK